MGFLSDVERENLRIEAMVFHVVGDGDFVPEAVRAVEYPDFFKARILETDVAAVFEFNDVSATRDTTQEMACGNVSFEGGAQILSRDFARLHRANAGEGAFFIFALGFKDPLVKVYSMIKYDYREVLERAENEDGEQRLRRILHALTSDKKAVQKSALIRIIDGRAEAQISARDRTKVAPEIADYFAVFLDVKRNRSDEELNNSVVEVLRKTLQESKELLPFGGVARALQQAKNVLRNCREITEEIIFDAILTGAGHPQDEDLKAQLRERTRRKINSQKLTGLAFPPDRNILRKPPLRKIRTTEGVTLMYPDDAAEVTVRRVPAVGGQGEVITITTAQIVEDTVVQNSTR